MRKLISSHFVQVVTGKPMKARQPVTQTSGMRGGSLKPKRFRSDPSGDSECNQNSMPTHMRETRALDQI
jgi:hypothetical protein